jgi:hypothetical protein
MAISEAKNRKAAAEAKVLPAVGEIASDVASAIVSHLIHNEVTTDEVKRVLIPCVAQYGAPGTNPEPALGERLRAGLLAVSKKSPTRTCAPMIAGLFR